MNATNSREPASHAHIGLYIKPTECSDSGTKQLCGSRCHFSKYRSAVTLFSLNKRDIRKGLDTESPSLGLFARPLFTSPTGCLLCFSHGVLPEWWLFLAIVDHHNANNFPLRLRHFSLR